MIELAGIYCNGMNTDLTEANNDRYQIEKLFHHSVYLLHNKSNFFTSSLMESFWNRRYGKYYPLYITKRLLVEVRHQLHLKRVVNLFGHSQGTLVCMNVLNLLSTNERKAVYCYLFAPVTNYEVDKSNIFDYVAGQDLIVRKFFKPEKGFSGKLFFRPSGGHNLVADYLKHFGEFHEQINNGSNRFDIIF